MTITWDVNHAVLLATQHLPNQTTTK